MSAALCGVAQHHRVPGSMTCQLVSLVAMASEGFLTSGPLKKDDEAGFRNHRAAGIVHGRVAMMAELGGVAQHCIGFSGFDDGRWICTS